MLFSLGVFDSCKHFKLFGNNLVKEKLMHSIWNMESIMGGHFRLFSNNFYSFSYSWNKRPKCQWFYVLVLPWFVICVIIFLQVLVIRYTSNKYGSRRKQEITTGFDALLSSGVFETSFQFWFLHLLKFACNACNKYQLDFLETCICRIFMKI